MQLHIIFKEIRFLLSLIAAIVKYHQGIVASNEGSYNKNICIMSQLCDKSL